MFVSLETLSSKTANIEEASNVLVYYADVTLLIVMLKKI